MQTEFSTTDLKDGFQIDVYVDTNLIEVFVNDGEYVFSTRYYPDKYSINVQAEGADICLAEIK